MGVSIQIAIREILEILFLLDHPNNFLQNFYIFPREKILESHPVILLLHQMKIRFLE